jgi:hypothetical protein
MPLAKTIANVATSTAPYKQLIVAAAHSHRRSVAYRRYFLPSRSARRAVQTSVATQAKPDATMLITSLSMFDYAFLPGTTFSAPAQITLGMSPRGTNGRVD